jgi:hypothetical protein
MNTTLREEPASDKEMARLAGLSPTSLRAKVKSGFFKPGEHFYEINPGGQRSHRRWKVAATLGALEVQTVAAAHFREPPTTYAPMPVTLS